LLQQPFYFVITATRLADALPVSAATTFSVALPIVATEVRPTPIPSQSVSPTPPLAPTSTPVPLPTPTAPALAANRAVEKIPLSGMNLEFMGGTPLQVQITVRGILPDECSVFGPVNQRQDVDNRTLWVEVNINRPRGQNCALTNTPFTEKFWLDLSNLPAGKYTINVNGISGWVEMGMGPATTP